MLSWDFLTDDIPFSTASRGRRHRARDRRHARDHRCGATLMAVPLGVLGGIYLNEYGGQRRSSPRSCGSSPRS